MASRIQQIKELIEEGNLQDAEALLNMENGGGTIENFLLLGKIKQKQQQWGPAINAYQKVLSIERDNKEAKLQMDIINGILNFNNPEMFNP